MNGQELSRIFMCCYEFSQIVMSHHDSPQVFMDCHESSSVVGNHQEVSWIVISCLNLLSWVVVSLHIGHELSWKFINGHELS